MDTLRRSLRKVRFRDTKHGSYQSLNRLNEVAATENYESPTKDFQLSLPNYESSTKDFHSSTELVKESTTSLEQLLGKRHKKPSQGINGKYSDGRRVHSLEFLDSTGEREGNNLSRSTGALSPGSINVDINPIAKHKDDPGMGIHSLEREPRRLQPAKREKEKWKSEPILSEFPDDERRPKEKVGSFPNVLQEPAEERTSGRKHRRAHARGDPQTVDELRAQVFMGNLEVKVPNTDKIVRIFTSSTFTDTQAERNTLMERVYPKLKEFCQEHGYEFQVVDMRWGVRDASTDDHATTELCLRELKACQKLSTGPNFVTFFGQKYGFRPFPPKILSTEYDKLYSAVDNTEDKKLLDVWFKLDENAVPPEYVLQPISSQFPAFVDPPNKEARRTAQREWWDVYLNLQNTLRAAAKKVLSKEEAHKYFMSVTENEIRHGIIESSQPNDKVLWFKRTITDIGDNIKSEKSAKFIDIVEVAKRKRSKNSQVREVDKPAQYLLKNLQSEIRSTLDKSNIFSYDIKWTSEGVTPEGNLTHGQYLGKLCTEFYDVMKKKITDAITKRAAGEVRDKEHLFQEVAQHATFCNLKCENFHGREDILEKIRTYISGSGQKPLVLYGDSGCGKTSLVAMTAKLVPSWTEYEPVVVLRFLGTTPDSSNIRLVLRSACLQLCKAFGTSTKVVPQDYQDLLREFQDRLKMAKPNRPIVVILDSADQLTTTDDAHQMVWLPRKLPKHVYVLVSTLKDPKYVCYSALKKLLLDSNCFVEVSSLPSEVACNILTSWLSNDNRRLTDSQRKIVLNAFNRCPLPLYLRLVYDHAVTWKSYTPLEKSVLEKNVQGMIKALFKRLERRHGTVLVRHALAYITAAKHGLSEPELEDILSCDEEVLDEVFQYWTPPVRRIPPLLWARIRAELNSYVVERGTDGARVVTWYHRQFHEVATKRYLTSDDMDLKTVHSVLADFFHGRWSQGAKKDDGKGGLKNRHVSAQPYKFSPTVYNLRKLNELPYHLINSNDVEKLKQHALCNLEFLSSKLSATSPRHLLEDFADALGVFPADKDIKLVCETLQLSRDALTISADQLPAQLIGRLSSPRSPSDVIARLLRQAHHPINASFIPNIACLTRPGGKLVHSLPGLYGSLVLSKDSSRALSGTLGKVLKLWDVLSGHVLKSIETSSEVGQIAFYSDEKYAVASLRGAIQSWDLNTGKMENDLEGATPPAPITIAGDHGNILVAILDTFVKIVDLSKRCQLKRFEDEDYVHDRIASLKNHVAFASSSERYVRVFDLSNLELPKTIEAFGADSPDVVSTLILSPFNDGQLIVSSQKSFNLRVFDLGSLNCLHVLGPDILYPAVTGDGRFMLCANCYNDVSVWNVETATKERNVIRHPPTTAITHIVTNDMKIIVTVSDDKLVRVWDLEREESANVDFEDNKGDNSIEHLMLIKSIVQKQVVTKSRAKGPICVWNVSNCQPIRTLIGTEADEVLVVDETRAVIRSGAKLALVDLQEGKLVKKMRSEFNTKTEKVNRHASSLYKRRDLAIRLAESPHVNPRYQTRTRKFNDCALVGNTHVLVLSKDRLYMKLASLATGEPVAKLKAGQKAIIETIMVSGNGAVAVCACESFPLLVWDIKERRKRFALEMEGSFPQLAVADISHNGAYLVDVIRLDRSHRSVVTWDMTSGTVKHVIGQGLNVWSVAISCESMRMVVTGSSGSGETMRIYDLNTGEFKHQLGGHTEPIKGLSLSRDGRRLLSYVPMGARDRSVCLWDVITGCPIASFTPDLPVSSCVLSDDGDQVVMVINKSRPIVSLVLTHEVGSRELSVDVSNQYFSHPTLHGAVFDMSETMNWDDTADDGE
ncbi:NACHT and WD repeat domain-containing protein 2 isoform X2 [Nematostella vectensis]|uniref:NACHT and WD repeat domain-containing protein 2 isoform X2 n=1 Tax=Nematostella vectensis TaxID=45351 RepID=UPI0020778E47|nr:NACHT and WD repeat domain-containing protein 2 isoform X2 [Nematostella vectensis]